MSIIRPATPGFVVTLTAAVLLAVVVFCVPYLKSVFFLKAAFTQDNITGWITLGTLGYCFNDGTNTNCSKPSIGYEFDPNKLLGNNLPVQIPSVVVKWLTYALVLHVVALGFAAVAAVFGLLAHVREMSMGCFSTCFSGAAAAFALLAFIFDLAFFFVAKGQINKVQGGSAVVGSAIWLTLAAWLMLFFAGCFFRVGRSCIGTRYDDPSRRKRRGGDPEDATGKAMPGTYNENLHTDSLRLDAIKAEADRKARAAAAPKEQGLPAFEEYERRPLRPQYVDEDELYAENSNPKSPGDYAPGPGVATAGFAAGVVSNVRRQQSGHSIPPSGGQYPGGYSSGAPGTRAVDDYYNAPTAAAPAPQPYRGATASPPVLGQSYPVGAVYGTTTTSTRKPSQSYAERFAPQPTANAGPYGPSHSQEPSYDPYSQYDTGIRYNNTGNYHQISGNLSDPSYYTTNNVATPSPAPRRQYSDIQTEPHYRQNSPQVASPVTAPLSPHPLGGEPPVAISSSQTAAHYGPRAMSTTSPTRGETNPAHDWKTVVSSSGHPTSQEESPPEYNLYDNAGPSIPAALVSGGPPRPEKH